MVSFLTAPSGPDTKESYKAAWSFLRKYAVLQTGGSVPRFFSHMRRLGEGLPPSSPSLLALPAGPALLLLPSFLRAPPLRCCITLG